MRSRATSSTRPIGRKLKGDLEKIKHAIEMMTKAKKPIFYTGGGVINSGPNASTLLRELVRLTGFPITSTLMGLGAYPASDKQWLGMLGMHGSFEANNAMHDCDLMICVGARFDDRITGRLDAFSPHSKKIHIDIDPSSINKNVKVDLGIIGDCAHVLEDMVRLWRAERAPARRRRRSPNGGRRSIIGAQRNSFGFRNSKTIIKPQHAIQRLYELTKNRDVYITTEVGQHQMWAAQHFHFEEPNRWMTSGGLGTMGYGLPAAIGAQMAHPKSLVIDIAGEASILMNMQEMSTAMQYRLPVKIFILNNQYMGMVRQWQELLHGGRYSESYTDSLPDFVKLAEAYGGAWHPLLGPGRSRRGDHGDDRLAEAGDLRLSGRSEGKLLPDDPVGQGAQRDDPRRSRRRRRRRYRRGHRREGQDAGLTFSRLAGEVG